MSVDTGLPTRTVLDSAASAGTLPGALLQTLVAHQVNAFYRAREVGHGRPRDLYVSDQHRNVRRS
jgi:kynureninase